MHIKVLSLQVKNCAALEDIYIDFTDDQKPQSVIVLGGANGSGKTTVLELIFAFFQKLRAGKHTPYSYEKIPDIFLEMESAEITFRIERKNQTGIIHQQFAKIGPEWRFNDLEIKLLGKMSSEIGIQEVQELHKVRLLNCDIIPSILYFPHNRELFPVKGKQIYQEDIKYQWCYRYQHHRDFQGSLESYLIWLDYAEPELFKTTIDFLNQLNFEGKTFHIHRKSLSVRVKTRDGNEHPFSKLSSGEQNILIMLFDLQRRLIPGSIVLLDEIENSLHPAFQYSLAKKLLQLQHDSFSIRKYRKSLPNH